MNSLQPAPVPQVPPAPAQPAPLGVLAVPPGDSFVEAFHMSRPAADYSYYMRITMNAVVVMLADALALLDRKSVV